MTPIHFSHANGFPGETYQALFQALEQRGLSVDYLSLHGHNPRFPVADNWLGLVDELIETIKQRHQRPVIAVGHSLGGVLSAFAAEQQPHLFKAVILLDSPVLTALDCSIVNLAKRLGLIDKITPAGRTKGRRNLWVSREEAKQYFSKRSLFAQFTEQCLDDYVEHGLVDHNTGVALRYDPEIEVSIYRTIPHIKLSKHYKVPTALVYGKQSDVIRRHQVSMMRRQRNFYVREVAGSHMFPLEDPIGTAGQIIHAIQQLRPGFPFN
ncbi:alpha/beta fold hydrolase [Spartinivicinus marinus]|uniref:alpha/beta fold hydrolase n=1 Tax=Spartinivicinus marinus TaxID=2994442 RepID=UPI001C5C9713|nr:alpha/beta hydrolase [Spartinivicinus marinus]MCX4024875.1 alpha/beta hydrolase [Spartinivicinus marinus]